MLKPLIYLLAFTTVLSAAPLQIARDGKSQYVIATPDSPSLVEKTAAKELQTHLQKITGTKLDVVTEKSVGNKPAFFIGKTVFFKKFIHCIELSSGRMTSENDIFAISFKCNSIGLLNCCIFSKMFFEQYSFTNKKCGLVTN